ncbi:venom allergen 5 isoform X2 [Anastrepha obliqua]|uniref:venom allergen 5 isoform X2 n=1 Tax=Anastrepha obliqua TaxID=95512 RepID=UPI00240A916A|nr:venom allergen 5 isoform X2 [Anastrepha obliqua]
MEILPQKYLIHAALLLASCSVALACRGQLLVSGLSPGEREIILHEHNKLRQLVATGRYPGQPGAENMREIVWDDELAARAQQWANNCEFRHDPLRTINRFTMGQNLAIIWSTAPLDPTDGDFPSRIQSWFNEVQKYSFGDAWSPKTGHYSQLVWGETSLVGCGFSEYKDSTKYNKLYVCNYGPGGNVVGYNPYEVGKPSCATYGLRSSSRYQGLCAPSVAPFVSANAIDTRRTHLVNVRPHPVQRLAPQFIQPQVATRRTQLRPVLTTNTRTNLRHIGRPQLNFRGPYRSTPY